jgi:TfoX/Sxy family transcriptional regulator of competence genes
LSTLTLQEKDIDANIFSNPLTARLGPVNYRPVFGGDEPFAEDVVRNMGQTIKMMFG